MWFSVEVILSFLLAIRELFFLTPHESKRFTVECSQYEASFY
jgi:hypothetical protein